MFLNLKWYWHLSCLEKMIKNNQMGTDKFKKHLRKFQNCTNRIGFGNLKKRGF